MGKVVSGHRQPLQDPSGASRLLRPLKPRGGCLLHCTCNGSMQEAETGLQEFQVSLGSRVRSCLKREKSTKKLNLCTSCLKTLWIGFFGIF